MMLVLAWALVILIASMFFGLIVAAWMRRQDDDVSPSGYGGPSNPLGE